jgi:hypothetical protein
MLGTNARHSGHGFSAAKGHLRVAFPFPGRKTTSVEGFRICPGSARKKGHPKVAFLLVVAEGVVHIMGWKAHETSVFSDLKFEVPPKVPPGRSALLLQLLKLIAQQGDNVH